MSLGPSFGPYVGYAPSVCECGWQGVPVQCRDCDGDGTYREGTMGPQTVGQEPSGRVHTCGECKGKGRWCPRCKKPVKLGAVGLINEGQPVAWIDIRKTEDETPA